MPPSVNKANYKTYEAQARLVRAIVAAHPTQKWNFKEIVACYGSDMTEHALNHRFRRLRAQSVIIREGRVQGFDMKTLACPDGDRDLPSTQEAVDKQNIAKYFGQSTPDGIAFQFRGIKKDADRLRQVEAEGGDVINCLPLGVSTGSTSAFSTPSKPTAARGGAGSRNTTGGSRKRTRGIPEIKRTSSDEEECDMADLDSWSAAEETPSKRPKATGAFSGQKNGTPSRRAAAKASATIAEAAARLRAGSSGEDQAEESTRSAAAQQESESIFGDVEEPYFNNKGVSGGLLDDLARSYMKKPGGSGYNPYGDLGDGEI